MSCWLLRGAWKVLALGSHSSLAWELGPGMEAERSIGSGRGLHTNLCDLTKANNAF